MSKNIALAALVLIGATVQPSTKTAVPVLPFIEDDYGKALTEARTTKRPIFVEAWAPW